MELLQPVSIILAITTKTTKYSCSVLYKYAGLFSTETPWGVTVVFNV